MIATINKDFTTIDDNYSDMVTGKHKNGFNVTNVGGNKRLKPDNELYRAITGDELLERINVSLDKFFAEK